MIIKADETGKAIIRQLCDLALKHAGLNNLQVVTNVLQSLQSVEQTSTADKEEQKSE